MYLCPNIIILFFYIPYYQIRLGFCYIHFIVIPELNIRNEYRSIIIYHHVDPNSHCVV